MDTIEFTVHVEIFHNLRDADRTFAYDSDNII